MAQMVSVAVFNSNDIYPISADSTMPFAQHRDISGRRSRGKHSITPDAPYEHQEKFYF
jgi:Xaa-Pro aminopeptidase